MSVMPKFLYINTLETNQVMDIMTLLYCYRRRLSRGRQSEKQSGIVGAPSE